MTLNPERCSVAGCDSKRKAKALCSYHYQKRREGEPGRSPCIEEGCDRGAVVKARCMKHHNRNYRASHPIERKLTGICSVEACETGVWRGMSAWGVAQRCRPLSNGSLKRCPECQTARKA